MRSKSVKKTAWCLLVFCLFVPSITFAQNNLIKNPEFKITTNPNGVPDDWALHTPLTGARVPHADYPERFCLELKAEKKIDDAIYWQQTGIPLKANKTYTFSYRVKGKAGQPYRVYIECSKPWSGFHADWEKTNGIWEKKTFTFSFSALGEPPYVILQVQSPGTVLFEEISIEEQVAEKSPVLQIDLDKPGYRNTVFSSDPVEQIEGHITVNPSEIKKVELTFGPVAGKSTFVKSFTSTKSKIQFQIPAKDMAVGEYVLNATGFADDGKKVQAMEEFISKKARAPIEVLVRDDQVLQINGKPFFPIGLWHCPVTERELYEISKAGFNTFWLPSALNEIVLDMAAKYHMWVISTFPDKFVHPMNKSEREVTTKDCAKKIEQFRNHPALLGYFLTDEPAWGSQQLDELISAYQSLRSLDPYHPIWINEAPRNTIECLAQYAKACDIDGVDIYPIPEGNGHSEMDDKTVSCVGKYTDKMRTAVADRKPIWMTLQGFAWAHYSNGPTDKTALYPNLEQTRFMAYDAVVHGATGIWFWGTYTIAEPAFWEVLFKTARELRDMSAVFVARTVDPSPVTVDQSAIKFLHKVCDGKEYIIAVNEGKENLTAVFTSTFQEKGLTVFFENRTVGVTQGRFTDRFKPNDVHVYGTGKILPASLVLPHEMPAPDGKVSFLESAKFLKHAKKYTGSANWIWFPGKHTQPGHQTFFRRLFQVDGTLESASLFIAADDVAKVYVNGKMIGSSLGWNMGRKFVLTSYLTQGQNLIAIDGKDGGSSPCGMVCDLTLKNAKGIQTLVSDSAWRVSEVEQPGWIEQKFDGKNWVNAQVIGPVGTAPWTYLLINDEN
jgi:hypothetical protein